MQVNNQYAMELTGTSYSGPSVSILMPFEPQMKAKSALSAQLEKALAVVENEIRGKYRNGVGVLVLTKLKNLIGQLNYNSFKKSVALYVSPVVEKILYLDIPVEEKVSVNGCFEIREIIRAKKEDRLFLTLVVSSDHSKIFLFDGSSLSRLNMNSDDASISERDLPEKVANFTDEKNVKEIRLHHFLKRTDQALSLLLQTYQLPVFVMGSPRILGHYKDLTKNKKGIVRFIQGNYTDASTPEIMNGLKPHLEDWHRIKSENMQHQFEEAASSGRLATGIQDVWKQANRHNARLLVVEENFSPAVILQPIAKEEAYPDYSIVKNTVDAVIEKVLEAGGDVEIVPPGELADYHHILLIEK